MKSYDFEKAKRIVEERKDRISKASLGMYEDWFWTAETIFEEGEWKKDLDQTKTIGGIDGSRWATPGLRIYYKDGEEETFIPCYIGKSTSHQPPFPNLGVLSGPVQANMPPINFKEDKPHA